MDVGQWIWINWSGSIDLEQYIWINWSMDLEQWMWINGSGSIDQWIWINGSGTMDLDKLIWINGFETMDLDKLIWINGFETMVLEQWMWINKVSTTSNYMIEWQVSDWCKNTKCQKKTDLEYLAVQLTFANLIGPRALSKEVRQAAFPRDGVPQNGAHRFWGHKKCKRNTLNKFHPPNTNRA